MARYDPGTVYECPDHALRLYAVGYRLTCAHELHRGTVKAKAIICPRCRRVSFSPDDVREGYCGNCHEWTGNRDES